MIIPGDPSSAQKPSRRNSSLCLAAMIFLLDGCDSIQGHGQNCGKSKLPNVGILTDLKRLEYLADAIDY
jgi:hypothetical protein